MCLVVILNILLNVFGEGCFVVQDFFCEIYVMFDSFQMFCIDGVDFCQCVIDGYVVMFDDEVYVIGIVEVFVEGVVLDDWFDDFICYFVQVYFFWYICFIDGIYCVGLCDVC